MMPPYGFDPEAMRRAYGYYSQARYRPDDQKSMMCWKCGKHPECSDLGLCRMCREWLRNPELGQEIETVS